MLRSGRLISTALIFAFMFEDLDWLLKRKSYKMISVRGIVELNILIINGPVQDLKFVMACF